MGLHNGELLGVGTALVIIKSCAMVFAAGVPPPVLARMDGAAAGEAGPGNAGADVDVAWAAYSRGRPHVAASAPEEAAAVILRNPELLTNKKFSTKNDELANLFVNLLVTFLKKLRIFQDKGHDSRQESGICRCRRGLSNEYLIAAIDVDTAESVPFKV